MLPPGALEEKLFLTSSTSNCLLACFDISWLVAASLQSLPLSSYCLLLQVGLSSVCLLQNAIHLCLTKVCMVMFRVQTHIP